MSTHRLHAWANGWRMGTLAYHDDTWRFAFDYVPKWVVSWSAFPLSPALPFNRPAEVSGDHHSVSVRRFFENLLPEGKALDDAVAAHRLSKANLYGLLLVLGRESTGAISLLPEGIPPEEIPYSRREVSRKELAERIRGRTHESFNVWDGRVRMSIAGFQDKLAVYIEDEQLYLVEGRLASTHILKPESLSPNHPHLVANEHFCLRLAESLGLSSTGVDILRVPEPVLEVARFDRRRREGVIDRLHVIDACQALDLAVSHNYERNFGNGRDVAHIRNGVSVERLFSIADLALAAAPMRLGLLRWALVQYLIGNSDTHGKNVSFFVEPGGLRLAPSYDLVAVCVYPEVDHELAMAIGDEFDITKVRAYDWAEFALNCGLDRRLVAREMTRMAKRLRKVLPELQGWSGYEGDERRLIGEIAEFTLNQADRLESDAKQLPDVPLD
ncbi:MAG: HipA domain-containing protein [Gammaproteobacteria bacterium]|nr:HipA domain-containing protein [Gammaproteobacteria bacterium]MBU1962365.1 HipA domain-containing protein [Gammaproteobacteria bacterium]